MVCQQAGKQRREQDLTGILQPGDELGIRCLIIADHLQTLPGGGSALASSAQQFALAMLLRQRCCTHQASSVVLALGVATPGAQQGRVITGLATEQAQTEPVGLGAKDRTCFGEQPL